MTCPRCNGLDCKRFGFFGPLRLQRFRCCGCGKAFSEDPKRLLGNLRIPEATGIQIARLLAEGIGVRASARLAGCHRDTVLAVLEVIGASCEAFLDRAIRGLRCESIQIDELWAPVLVKQRNNHHLAPDRGDFYTFLALDARSKLILAHRTGKRNENTTTHFIADLATRVDGRTQITTDGWKPYQTTIPWAFENRVDFAIQVKSYGNEPADMSSARHHLTPVVKSVKVHVIEGDPDRRKISTSYCERANLSVRTFNRRFTRLCMGFSKKVANHAHSMALFVAAHNFCRKHHTLKTTPAVAHGLTDHVWTIEELLREAAKVA